MWFKVLLTLAGVGLKDNGIKVIVRQIQVILSNGNSEISRRYDPEIAQTNVKTNATAAKLTTITATEVHALGNRA